MQLFRTPLQVLQDAAQGEQVGTDTVFSKNPSSQVDVHVCGVGL